MNSKKMRLFKYNNYNQNPTISIFVLLDLPIMSNWFETPQVLNYKEVKHIAGFWEK